MYDTSIYHVALKNFLYCTCMEKLGKKKHFYPVTHHTCLNISLLTTVNHKYRNVSDVKKKSDDSGMEP